MIELRANGDSLFQDTINGGAGHDRYEADDGDVLIVIEERISS